MQSRVKYFHLKPRAQLPSLNENIPFKAVILVESEVDPHWQMQVSDWLVGSGCLYALACGLGCSEWDDSIDFANIMQFEGAKIPDDSFVMTTWHEDEALIDVFEFAKHLAIHLRLNWKQPSCFTFPCAITRMNYCNFTLRLNLGIIDRPHRVECSSSGRPTADSASLVV